MAVLLLVLTGVLTPWLIGFAGFYDNWQWLTFFPIAQPLLVPPLLLAYVEMTIRGSPLQVLRAWFLPGFVAVSFELASFILPLSDKLEWAEVVGRAFRTAENLLLIVLFALVLRRVRRLVADYRKTLTEQRSDEARFGLTWLLQLTSAMTILWSVWALYALTDTVIPLSFDGLMPLYLAIAGASVWLAIQAWRYGNVPWPRLQAVTSDKDAPPRPTRDWQAEGGRWATVLRESEAYREPALTLRGAARIVGTNEAYLSRAFNEGLGLSFSAVIQGLRSDAVAAAIERGGGEDLLTLAHDAGFASKASFNRAFAARFGVPPSTYRRRLRIVKN
ncbi:AraC family transcriptional regulator [Sphingomonas piscis]|uniref:AraC family transcriptional regulator n=1 Tax=Sphingomonas piscis TaxID=2714943 RepID=A0A6G7YMK6_9SPHN|nr:helix-turn-helix domain-containing protein [Sphingomonas piscis]QIK77980.1 AraC family transcriptional regulator [Sphingomonas piscis]